MKAIFLKELKRTRRGLLIWSALIALLTAFAMLEYPHMKDVFAQIGEIMQTVPKIVPIMFGLYGLDFGEPLAFFACIYYWVTLLSFTHAAFMGGSILSKEQRDKTAEYLYTKPQKRDAVVLAKALAAAVNVAVIALVCGLASVWTMIPVGLPEGGALAIIASIFGMFLTQLVFMALGILFSALARDYKRATRASIIALLWGFALCFSIQYAGNIDFLRILTPVWYFPVLEVLEKGVSPPYALLSVLITAAAICFAVRLYRKKEFYV